MVNFQAPFASFSPDLRFFLVFHYFRSKHFQSFIKSLDPRPSMVFPATLRTPGSTTPIHPSLVSPLAGFSFVVSFTAPDQTLNFVKTLQAHPRAGFILFYCFEGITFLPSDLSRVLEFYKNPPSGFLMIRPISSLVLSQHRQFQIFFLQSFFKFFLLFSKRISSSHANL